MREKPRGKESGILILHHLSVGMMNVNCYIVACSKTREACAIDPGGDVERILDLLKQERLKLKYIVNTHGHADHIMGVEALREATEASLCIHAGDAAMLIDGRLNLSSYMGFHLDISPAERILQAGDEIRCGELVLKVLYTPGHSPGGICLLCGDVLFSGDTLFAGGVGRTDFPGGSHVQLIQSIKETLLVLPEATKVYPGHGPSTSIGQEIHDNMFLK